MDWKLERLPRQTGRTIVVTGATGGIGYFAAEQLAATGADVILAARSSAKLRSAEAAIRTQVPDASLRSVVIELGSLASVDDAIAELAESDRLDGILLNGGAMTMSRRETTADGIPLLLGTHVVAHVRLIAGLLPSLTATASAHDTTGRIVHASTGFVRRFRYDLDDLRAVPRTGIGAYTKAKTATEVFAFELDRRLRASQSRVLSLVTHPGVGVDARTPTRPGIRDSTVPYRRNPYTPWAQGKDAAAWSSVRALTDPDVQGGEYFGPREGRRGAPVRIEPTTRTAEPPRQVADSVWQQLETLAGVRFGLTSPAALG